VHAEIGSFLAHRVRRCDTTIGPIAGGGDFLDLIVGQRGEVRFRHLDVAEVDEPLADGHRRVGL